MKDILFDRFQSCSPEKDLNTFSVENCVVPFRKKPVLFTVVIPVYNEEKTVFALLERIRMTELPGFRLELIIVNDGSRDQSAEQIRLWMRLHQQDLNGTVLLLEQENQGKGTAVRLGISKSHGEVLIIQDADLEYDPADYLACVTPILEGRSTVVYGSRQESGKNRLHSSPLFYLGGIMVSLWIDLLYHTNLTDEPTCYKAFRGDVIRSLDFEGNGFEWEVEVTAKLLRLGFEITEVPIAYTPRKIHEGKKIRWTDGIHSLWTALYWKFAPLKNVRQKMEGLPGVSEIFSDAGKSFRMMSVLVILAALIRILYSIPGMIQPELLFRPDTHTYLGPAFSLLTDGTFSTGPGSGEAALIRTPGYPLYLSLLLGISNGSYPFCILVSCLLGAFILVPVYHMLRLYFKRNIIFWIMLLLALNPTAIAYSPMFLSDSLFALFTAFQTCFFIRFLKSRFIGFFFLSVGLAATGALIRPINMAWVFPCVFVMMCLPGYRISEKIRYALCSFLIFAAILFPWMYRNHALEGGWRFDGISADRLKHEAATVQAKAEGKSVEMLRQEYERKMSVEFASDPVKYRTPDSRFTWQEKEMKQILLKYPRHFVFLHFQPFILAPDVPVFLENLGITQGGKNTLDVINHDGIFAGVRHYFDGAWGPFF